MSTSQFSITNSFNDAKKAIHKALYNPNAQAALGVATIATAAAVAYYFTQSTPTPPPAPSTYDGSLPCQGMSFPNTTIDAFNMNLNSSLFAASLEQRTPSINHTLNDFSNHTSNLTLNSSEAVNNPPPSLAPTSPATNFTKQFLDLLRPSNRTLAVGSNNATNLTSESHQDAEPFTKNHLSSLYTEVFHLKDNRQTTSTPNEKINSVSPQALTTNHFTNRLISNTPSDLSNSINACSQNPETLEEHLAALSNYFINTQIPSIQARVANEFHALYNWTKSSFEEILTEKADRKAFYDAREFSKILYGVNKQNKQCAEMPTTLVEKADALVNNALVTIKEKIHYSITSQLTPLQSRLSQMDKESVTNFINTINLMGTTTIVAAALILAKNKPAAESSFLQKLSTFTLIVVPMGLIRINNKPIASEAITVGSLRNQLSQWLESKLTATLDYLNGLGDKPDLAPKV